MARSKNSIQRIKERAKVLSARIQILEEENQALKMAAAIEGFKIEHRGTAKRIYLGKSKELAIGQLILPLPRGWIVDTNFSTACFTIERHGQKYAEIQVIQLEE